MATSSCAAVRENLNYLNNLKRTVKTALKRKDASEFLDQVTVDSCGKSRVHLGGLASSLHQRNLKALYRDAQQKGLKD
jgi:hypothetical protein